MKEQVEKVGGGLEQIFKDIDDISDMEEGYEDEYEDDYDDEEGIEIMEMTDENLTSMFETEVDSNPEFEEKLRSLTGSLEVINSLGFGDSGNIILKKTAKGRELVPVSQIVGYRIKNIGETDIEYLTEIWGETDEGVYDSEKISKVLKPGKFMDITRQYMTMFCSIPEISFTLSNGIMVKGSGYRTAETIKDQLESFYFKFKRGEDGVLKRVNDAGVKINVGEKVGDKWVVKSEFTETFGFLNNVKESDRGEGSKKSKLTKQELEANYINKMVVSAGL